MKGGRKPLSDEAFAFLCIIPLIVFVLALNAYPLGYSFWLSFQVARTNPVLHYVFAGLVQYSALLRDASFWKALGVTIHFDIEAVVFSLLIGLTFAYLMNETFKGRGIFRAVILLPWAVSEYCTGLIWNFMYQPAVGFLNSALVVLHVISNANRIAWINPTDAVESVSLAYAWHMAPLISFFLLAGLQFIPEDLTKQAKIDGAGFVRRFRTVTLPFLRYPMLISMLLVVAFASKTVDIIITLTGGGPAFESSPLTNFIYNVSFNEFNFPYGAAASFYLIAFIFVITMVMFIFMTREFGRK